MTQQEIRLQVLKLAFEIAREGSYAAIQDVENHAPGAHQTRAELVPHVEDVLELADSLMEFVDPDKDDEDFFEMSESVDFDPQDDPPCA